MKANERFNERLAELNNEAVKVGIMRGINIEDNLFETTDICGKRSRMDVVVNNAKMNTILKGMNRNPSHFKTIYDKIKFCFGSEVTAMYGKCYRLSYR